MGEPSPVKIVLPLKFLIATFILLKFFSFTRFDREKIIFDRPLCEFCPKIEFKRPLKFKMTVKVSEALILC